VEFRKINSVQPAAEYIAGVIFKKLIQNLKVLWLLPGGSSIDVAVSASGILKGKDLKNLCVTLTDERYGHIGHNDSNWKQLEDRGFSLPGAKMHPVLEGKDFDQTLEDFDRFLIGEMASVNYHIGFFGIGPDGHTAGILPKSPATSARTFASGYLAPQFIRITMTFPAIEKLDEAVVYTKGEPKWPILTQLEDDIPLKIQPAQILKRVPKLTIFNDYKGEEI
jgi:6-phosphogluconolactonase/glucosamine-6-phosphate isomerase/deaminase